MRIPQALIDQLVAHAREEAPNECCGWIGARDGVATTVYRARNEFSSPLRYRIHAEDTKDIFFAMDEAGEEALAAYHSHTRSAPIPSETDVNEAHPWVENYLIVGVSDAEAEVRAYRLERGSGFTPIELGVG